MFNLVFEVILHFNVQDVFLNKQLLCNLYVVQRSGILLKIVLLLNFHHN